MVDVVSGRSLMSQLMAIQPHGSANFDFKKLLTTIDVYSFLIVKLVRINLGTHVLIK